MRRRPSVWTVGDGRIALPLLCAVMALSGCGESEPAGKPADSSGAAAVASDPKPAEPSRPDRSQPGEGTAGEPGSGREGGSRGADGPHAGDAAQAAGMRACRGLSPAQAVERYARPARDAGVSKRLVRLVSEPPARVRQSEGFGRLVAAVYAATVPTARREAAAAGCAAALERPGGGR